MCSGQCRVANAFQSINCNLYSKTGRVAFSEIQTFGATTGHIPRFWGFACPHISYCAQPFIKYKPAPPAYENMYRPEIVAGRTFP